MDTLALLKLMHIGFHPFCPFLFESCKMAQRFSADLFLLTSGAVWARKRKENFDSSGHPSFSKPPELCQSRCNNVVSGPSLSLLCLSFVKWVVPMVGCDALRFLLCPTSALSLLYCFVVLKWIVRMVSVWP